MMRSDEHILYKNAFHHSAIGIAVVSPDGEWLKVNSSFCEILGYSMEDILQVKLRDLVCSDDIALEDALKMKRYKKEVRFIHKNNDMFWCQLTSSLVSNDDGVPIYLIMQIQDIHERKQLKLQLKESEARYRQLVQYSPEPMVIHSEGKIVYINEAAVKAIGAKDYKRMLGQPIDLFIHPEYRDIVLQRVRTLMKQNQPLPIFHIRILNLQGRVMDAQISSMPIQYQGKPSVQVFLSDITEQKQLEQTIRESEERYRFITENSSDIIAVLSITLEYLYVSPASSRILGYDPDELIGKSALDHIHPHDVPKLTSVHFEVIDELNVVTMDYRIRRKTGEFIWLESTARTVRHGNGTLKEIHAVSRDITERKLLHEELVRMNNSLRMLTMSDGLTGIANRRYFEETLDKEWRRITESSSGIALILIDIDLYKNYNDTYGHQAGDECLIRVAQCLKTSLKRSSDIAARYGGEEFAILMPDASLNQAKRVADYLRKKVLDLKIEHRSSSVSPYITISLGVAAMNPKAGDQADELIRRADDALYAAKQAGKNTCKVYGQ